jgi:hypothetical protein
MIPDPDADRADLRALLAGAAFLIIAGAALLWLASRYRLVPRDAVTTAPSPAPAAAPPAPPLEIGTP